MTLKQLLVVIIYYKKLIYLYNQNIIDDYKI